MEIVKSVYLRNTFNTNPFFFLNCGRCLPKKWNYEKTPSTIPKKWNYTKVSLEETPSIILKKLGLY